MTTDRAVPLGERLANRPRRHRHRATPIQYALSQAEFLIMGTACSVLGALAGVFVAQILFGAWA